MAEVGNSKFEEPPSQEQLLEFPETASGKANY